jgi:SUMO ligase MMS21 Smc5/6 complex component
MSVKTESKDDELEVEEVDALVSLRCPLSIDRIVTPAKGRLCSHRRCFDLEVSYCSLSS